MLVFFFPEFSHNLLLYICVHFSLPHESKGNLSPSQLFQRLSRIYTLLPLLNSSFSSTILEASRRLGPLCGTPRCSICHYEVFWFCNMEPDYKCSHVCVGHSWHSTPTNSVFTSHDLTLKTTDTAAGMLLHSRAPTAYLLCAMTDRRCVDEEVIGFDCAGKSPFCHVRVVYDHF